MEVPKSFEQEKPDNISRRMVSGFIAGLRLYWRQLEGADLNPRAGKLRVRIIPLKYIKAEVPDYPPADDSEI